MIYQPQQKRGPPATTGSAGLSVLSAECCNPARRGWENPPLVEVEGWSLFAVSSVAVKNKGRE